MLHKHTLPVEVVEAEDEAGEEVPPLLQFMHFLVVTEESLLELVGESCALLEGLWCR